MPTTSHSVVVTIDGVDRSSSLLYDALSVRVGVGNTGNVADLQVVESQGYVPQAWDEVLVTVNGTRIFGGYVATRTAQGLAAGSSRTVQWSLACRDWSMLLDKIIVSDQFSSMTDANIVSSLFTDYLAGNGFTLTQVQYTQAGITIGFDRITLRQALNKLAEQVGAAWYIDPLKGVYWYNRWSPPRSAFDIDTVAPNNSTTFDVLAGSFRRTIDDTRALNRIEVFGKDIQGALVSDSFSVTSAGVAQTFGPLTQPVHSLYVLEGWTLISSSAPTTMMGSFIGYEPEAVLYDPAVAWTSRTRYIVVNRETRMVKTRLPDDLAFIVGAVTISYYTTTPIQVTVDDTDLQGLHERILTQQVYDTSIADEEQAERYGRYMLDVYGHGAETVTFDVPEFGLLPGSEINVYSPTLGLDPVVSQADLLLQDANHWLLESGDQLLQESYGLSLVALLNLESDDQLLLESGSFLRLEAVRDTGSYIVQEVTYKPVHTPTGWMMVASVTAGELEQSLIDIVAKLSGGAGVAGLPTAQLHGRLSDVASDLGEVVAGRALFTDGGMGAFNWGTPNGHTGVVVGLDDSSGTPAGALYIYDAGTNRLKLGKLDGLAAVGTVNPTGWGIWTDNGFFKGQVAASVVQGGTIAGALIYGGTIRTSPSVVNSSNPGVTMDSSGLYGYGTLGLSFFLPTDPALRPIFSSGTILNTVYEVTTASVLRTGTVNPKVQIDNSGIFAYNAAGALKFSVNAATGLLTAVDGSFSGSVTASVISGGTVSGALVTAGTVSGGTVTGSRVSGGTVSGALVSGGTVSGALVTAGTVSGGTVSGALVSGGTVSGALMTAGTVRFTGTYGTAQLTDAGMSMQVGTASVSEANAVGMSFLGTAGSDLVAKIYMVKAPTYRNMILNSKGANDYIDFQIGGNGILTVQSDGLNCGKSVFPASSSLDLTLGVAGGGWRYLYLKDNLGNIKRLEINNGTVLIS